MKTAIVTDSNSGITQKEGKELGIFVLPMPFLIDGETYFEDINLTQEAFYERLQNGATVSTSQPSIGEVTELWERVLEEYDELVYIPMSSGLSQSCATAKTLAADYNGRVQVVDNHRISVTLKDSILDALALVRQGKSAQEIKNYLEETALQSSIYIAVDTMKYLKRGGRVTPAAATIGTILKLKPVLEIQGERLDKFALTRGLNNAKETMKKALRSDFETRFKKEIENGELVFSVAYTYNRAEAEKFAEELKETFGNVDFRFIDPLSLSVACHIGPGSLAVACSKILK